MGVGESGITVSYAQGSELNPLQDVAGNFVADFSGQQVTNNTRDTTRPPTIVGPPPPPSDTAPSFGTAMVPALMLDQGVAMTPVTLPQATGGNGVLTYSLTSEPAGLARLAFDPATRRLTGTPGTVGDWTFTYRADDADANRADSDAAQLSFAVTVEDPRLALLRRSVRRALAAVWRRALTSALDNIGARLASSVPASGLTLAGQTMPFGAVAGTGDGEGSCAREAAGRDGLARGFVQPGPDTDREGCASVARTWSVEPADLAYASAFSLTLAGPRDRAWVRRRCGRCGAGAISGPSRVARSRGCATRASCARAGWAWMRGPGRGWRVSRSAAEPPRRTTASWSGPVGERALETTLTALYPYGRMTVSEGLELRGVLGAGWGEARHQEDEGEVETSGLSMWMGSVGLRHQLPSLAGIDLAAQGDVNLSRIRTDEGPEFVDGQTADSWRLRAGLEASRRVALDEASALVPFVEATARRDGGDGLEGTGLEVAGGLRYTAPRLHMEARGRWLAVHSEQGASERGVSLTVRMGPGAQGRGLSLALTPRWGAGTGLAEELWRDELPQPAGAGEAAAMDARIGYGLGVPPYGVLTPFAETGLAEADSRRLRLGTRFEAPRMHLDAAACGRAPGGRRGRTGALAQAGSQTAVSERRRRACRDTVRSERSSLCKNRSPCPATVRFLAWRPVDSASCLLPSNQSKRTSP